MINIAQTKKNANHCDKENASPNKKLHSASPKKIGSPSKMNRSPRKQGKLNRFQTTPGNLLQLQQTEKESKLFKHVVEQIGNSRQEKENTSCNNQQAAQVESGFKVSGFQHKYSSINQEVLQHKDESSVVAKQLYSVKFTQDSTHFACGFEDGSIKLYNAAFGFERAHIQDSKLQLPVSCLAFKPKRSDENHYTLLTSTVDGQLYSWRPEVDDEFTLKYSNPKNQYSCMGISNNGEKIALAGKLPMIEIIDEQKDTKIMELHATTKKGHNNRIFCAKFFPLNHSMVYSGGWDKKVCLWDLRSGSLIEEINGPLIGGDSVDMRTDGLEIVTGCNQIGGGIQTWDLRNMKCLNSFDWKDSNCASENQIPIKYCKYLMPYQDVVVAGGPQGTHAKAFDVIKGRQIHKFDRLNQACLLSDNSDDGQHVFFAYKDGSHAIYNVFYKHQ